MNHRPWINFKELRARLQFEDVLRHYKIEVKSKGEQHHGPCPLPGHIGSKSAPSFSANLKRGIFQCFGCGAKGNVLEFAAFMEKVDIKNGDALRKVAVGLQERFFPEGASTRKKPTPPRAVPSAQAKAEPRALPMLVNEPIDFELKGLDRSHEYFSNSGITIETAQYFGIGFCSRGILAGRIAIPLHDTDGRLIGYAGQAVNRTAINTENPLYRFPTKREREGRVLDFDKSAFLYNGHRIKAPCNDLIVVEDFPSVWWLHQCGFRNVVGLMGDEYSGEQLRILVSGIDPLCKVRLLPSGREPSLKMADALLHDLAYHRFVRWTRLSEDGTPADLTAEELKICFTP